MSLHAMAAVKIPEMALTKDEAETVAKAYSDVAEFYPALQQTAKAAAWTELVAAVGWVYGMRLVAIRNNRMKNSEPGASEVIDIRTGKPAT